MDNNQRRNIKYIHLCLFSLMVAMLIFAAPVQAQEANPNLPSDDEVNEIAREMYCPVCENIPLDVCGTQACEQWRELIREKLAGGWTEAQIKDYFVLQYGDRVLAAPPARGFNWLLYIVPPVLFLWGAGILFFAFRRMRSNRVDGGSEHETPVIPQNETEDEYLARLERQMREG